MRVEFVPLVNRVRPKTTSMFFGPCLPARYSPLQSNENGIQSVYLAELRGPRFAEILSGLIAGTHAFHLEDGVADPAG